MRPALLTMLLGVAVALGGCANRLPTATQDTAQSVAPAPAEPAGYVVVRTTSRPVTTARSAPRRTYPAPPPPASVRLVRGSQPPPATRRIVIAPRRAGARVQPALAVPPVRQAPRRAKPAPTPCVDGALFAPSKDCMLDPCDPCAGGRCSVPK